MKAMPKDEGLPGNSFNFTNDNHNHFQKYQTACAVSSLDLRGEGLFWRLLSMSEAKIILPVLVCMYRVT